jgi:membrane fusion protein (multidrug efflux system)
MADAERSHSGEAKPATPPVAGSIKPSPKKKSFLRRPIGIAMIVVVLVGITYGVRRYLHSRHYESTDDAFIGADVVDISPRVASNVKNVLVVDNKHVNRGDLLLQLDPRDFQARLDQARASLAAATAQHRAAAINVRVVRTTSGANVQEAEKGVQSSEQQEEANRSLLEQARADVAVAQAEAVRAGQDVRRYQRLLASGAVSRQEVDNAVAANSTAIAKVNAARKAEQAAADNVETQHSQLGESQARLASARAAPDQIAQSRAQAEQAKAQITQLEAAVRLAELELSYATIHAPTSGRITRKSADPGDYVQIGQRVFSIVPDSVYVVANFKETQLQRMRPGQPVTLKVDAYPDRLFRGFVQSIQAGSGAAFSLLPPENATGNFVKIVQRVPVKILFAEPRDSIHVVLGPGMSVAPTVRVR